MIGAGASVREDYLHVSKWITPSAPFNVEGASLKWYDIASGRHPVPDDIHDLARASVRNGAATGTLELGGDLGFVVLHRCGEAFYYLLVSTWQNENELWETVWAKDGVGDLTFKQWPLAGTHHPTFCVWELAAVGHEQQAWTAYLQSARDIAARQAYLADAFSGEV